MTLTYTSIYIKNRQIEEVISIKYLGSLTNNNRSCAKDFKARVKAAKATFYSNKAISSWKIKNKLRDGLANCYIKNIATYASETWTLKAEEKRKSVLHVI